MTEEQRGESEPANAWIDYELVPGGIRFSLPRRRLRHSRLVGLGLAFLGATCLLLSASWIYSTALEGWRLARNGVIDRALFLLAMALFGSPFLSISLRILWFAQAVLRNATGAVVELRHGKLVARERFLPRRWFGIRLGLNQISRLAVDSDFHSSRRAADWETALARWLGIHAACLVAYTKRGNRRRLVCWYDEARIVSLVREFSRQGGFDVRLDWAGASPGSLDRVSSSFDSPRHSSMDDRRPSAGVPPADLLPSGSRILVEHRDDGVTVTIPPLGFRRGPKFLWGFAVLWLAGVLVFGIPIIASVVQANAGINGGLFAGVLIGWIVMALVGLILLMFAIDVAKRRTVAATADDSLLVIQQGLWGKNVRQWRTRELDSIEVGTFEANDESQPDYQLEVHLLNGKRHVMMHGFPRREIKRVAAELNDALRLEKLTVNGMARTDCVDRDESGRIVAPSRSRVTVKHALNRLEIDVPAKGPLKHIVFAAVSLMLGVAGFFVLRQAVAQGNAGGWLFVLGVVLSSVFVAGWIVYLVDATTRFQITVDRSGLRIESRNIFRRRFESWRAADLRAMRVVSSDTKVNGMRFYQVEVRTKEGDRFHFMKGRPKLELHTVAVAINEVLGLTERATSR